MFAISLNNHSPIHEQVAGSIEKLILTGVIEPDSPLPSVRELASELAVNPNTIQKAYFKLESEGITYSVAGKGRFATSDVNSVKKVKIKHHIDNISYEANLLSELGIDVNGILTELEKIR